MPDTLYVSLRDNAASLWPHQLIAQPPSDVLERIWFEPMRIIIDPTRKLRTGVLLTQNVEIQVPGLEQISMVLGEAGENTTFLLEIELEPVMLGRLTTPLAIRLRRTLLKPVQRVRDDNTGHEDFLIDHQAEYLDLSIADAIVTLDQDGNLSIASELSITLPLCSIGDTGLIIEARDVSFSLNPAAPAVALSEAVVLLPDYLPLPPAIRIAMHNAHIDSSGFTGEASLDLNLSYDEGNGEFIYLTDDPVNPTPRATIYGDLSGGLRHVRIAVEQNRLTTFDISGSLVIPYFDQPIDIRINFTPSGMFTVTLLSGSADGITLTKEELLALRIRALAISKGQNNVSGVAISGGLEPLLMSSDGLQWPQLDVTDLSIDTTGKFSIKEAWLDLKELATLDLWGFHFELRRIGIGSEEADDKLWVDLSGGLRLIEQIPVALDVEGFRLTWPRTLLDNVNPPLTLDDIKNAASQIEVEFDGIYLFYGVPDAVEFEGLIRFFKEAQLVGFAGDMALRVPASGFGAEAGLLIGLSFEPAFPFLYVYFGVDLPAGIPLGQSGLALKGAQGMFGLNVGPAKLPEQNWYYDWYKRGPIVGAHPTNKWKPEQNALALGVGVTITTTDGYVKGTRGLLVLSIPGPVLIIEGRALILSGLQPNAEPPLRALAVFDGRAGTVQFNVEAEATLIADLLKAYGMLEAFFDFNDLTNWHLYLGQDTPRDRRIRADILKLDNSFLFKADAYLMMDMVGADTLRSRLGVSIGFEPDVPDIDPLTVDFAATLDGDGLVTARPEQFSGEVDLDANIRLSALGVSLRLSADARFLTEGPEPLKVGAEVHVEAEMPAPLDPVEATLEFAWEAPRIPPVESPLSEIVVSSRFQPAGGGFRADAKEQKDQILDFSIVNGQWESFANQSPIVPVDSQPIIGFKHKMNSAVSSFARHPDGTLHHYDVGLFHFEPWLTTIKLYEHLKGIQWVGNENQDWTLIASTDPNDHKSLPGVWLVESEPDSPESPAPRRLQFWTDNPLSSSARALGPGYTQLRGAIQPGKPLAARLLDDYPDLMQCTQTKRESMCVDFTAAGKVIIEPGDSWEYEDLRFDATNRTVEVRSDGSSADACLFVDGYMELHFRRRVKKVRIGLCQPSKLSAQAIRGRIEAKRGIRSVAELKAANGTKGKGLSLADLRACNVNVEITLTVTDHEWFLEAGEGFDCLHIVRMDEFAIRAICYTTVEEIERSERAEQQCSSNATPSDDGQALRPGAYYRLDITTNVTGELHLEELPFAQDSFIGKMLETAYNEFVEKLTESGDKLPKFFHQTCLFQTEAPPTNLRPYVKWSSPQHQSERFFYGDNIAIRFLRSHLEQMFGEPFGLRIQIRDVQGKLVDGYRTIWLRAQSATLFPEESIWESHRSTLGWPAHAMPHDNILIAALTPASDSNGLRPLSRYRIEVVRADVTDPLLTSTFVTSGFDTFGTLVKSYSGTARTVVVKEHAQSALSSITELQQSAWALAQAQWNWEDAEIDHRFELHKDGRKGVEQARLRKREASAAHDAKFLALAERLVDLYFQPVSGNVELYLLRDQNLNAVVGAWIRSPESLDMRLEVLADPSNPDSSRIGSVGRTEVKLLRQNVLASDSPIVLHNADSTQLLIFPSPVGTWGPGDYEFVLSYHRDNGDETRTPDHRYDRPLKYPPQRVATEGTSVTEKASLKWSWQ